MYENKLGVEVIGFDPPPLLQLKITTNKTTPNIPITNDFFMTSSFLIVNELKLPPLLGKFIILKYKYFDKLSNTQHYNPLKPNKPII